MHIILLRLRGIAVGGLVWLLIICWRNE